MTARPKQTEIAVLGALSVEPMTGYAVRESIRDVLGHFWSESFGQIYPTLGRLEAEGMVRRGGASRTGASTFTVTDAGLRRLRERLLEPIAPMQPRDGLLLRLFFGRHIGVARCRELVERFRVDVVTRLAEYGRIRTEIETQATSDGDAPYWLLTLSAGEHHARTAIAWADQTLADLDRIERRRAQTTSKQR